MSKFSPFKQGLIGGLIILLSGTLIILASTAVAQDWFNPEDAADHAASVELHTSSLINSSTTVAISHNDLLVFQTDATFNGAGPAGFGRSAMHAACRAENPASHFCTIQEIETAWKNGNLVIALDGQAWVDNAILGTTNSDYSGDTTLASDWYGGNATGDFPYNCNAWTIDLSTARGLILNSGAISPATESCDDVHPIACCRRSIIYTLALPLIMR